MRKKKHDAESDSAMIAPATRPRLTPTDVQQKEFRLAFRGYNERDVDEFLDLVTEELAAYAEENRRLREEPASQSVDVADRSGDDEILARAREEAARIIREAEQRASLLAVGSAAAAGDSRAAVAPYLNREREFLQSLGQLVQSHAETIRGMVQGHRAAISTSPQAPAPIEAASEASREEIGDAITIPEEEPEPVKAEQQRSLRELFWGED
jgi:cell division initiation protein